MVKYNVAMSNSFYYFFSAVPQVLAAILALFGVFIIFKIQTAKTQLKEIVQSLYDDIISSKKVPSVIKDNKFYKELEEDFQKDDVSELVGDVAMFDSEYIVAYYEKYQSIFKSLKLLVRDTVRWSILSSILIIISLSILPFGNYILAHPFLIGFLFSSIIFYLIAIFWGLIKILTRSIKEW